MLGIFSDGTGIVQNEICLTDILSKAVTKLRQNALETFPIIDALLAAVGVNMRQRRGLIALAEILPDRLGTALLPAKRVKILRDGFALIQGFNTLSFK